MDVMGVVMRTKPRRAMFGGDRIVDIKKHHSEATHIVVRATGDEVHYIVVKDNNPGWQILAEYTTKESVEFRL